jgi:hypothetical protein
MAIDSKQFDELLAEITKIAVALNNPRSTSLSDEVPVGAAARNLDYLVLRQLMGRIRRDGEAVAIFPVGRKRGTAQSGGKAILTVGPVPDDAEKLAVFTQRGDPAFVVDLVGHQASYDAKTRTTTTTDYPLENVTNDQVITRLEFRRDDDYPLALGPRLPVV